MDESIPLDAARERVNSLLKEKLALDQTIDELISLGVSEDQLAALEDRRNQLLKDITDASNDL